MANHLTFFDTNSLMLEGHDFFSLTVKVSQSVSVRELTLLTVLTVLGLDSSCCIAKLLTVGSRVLLPDISILYTLNTPHYFLRFTHNKLN